MNSQPVSQLYILHIDSKNLGAVNYIIANWKFHPLPKEFPTFQYFMPYARDWTTISLDDSVYDLRVYTYPTTNGKAVFYWPMDEGPIYIKDILEQEEYI